MLLRRSFAAARCWTHQAHVALSSVRSFAPLAAASCVTRQGIDADDDPLDDLRARVLEAAVKHVPREGWSREAITAAVEELKLSPAAHGLASSGGVDLVYDVMDRASAHAVACLQATNLTEMPVNDRIAAGVWARLEFLAPYRTVWAQAMALGAQPQHAAATAERLLRAADDLWWASGDTSTDHHWYSRRLLLVSVLAASELHLLTDTSPGLADTRAFIERRVNDVSLFGRGAAEALSVGQEAATGVGSILAAGAALLQPLPAFFAQQLLGGRGASRPAQQPPAAAASSESEGASSPSGAAPESTPAAGAVPPPVAAAASAAKAIGSSGPGAAVSAALRSAAPQLVPGAGGPVDTLAKSVLPAQLASAGEAVVQGLFGGRAK